MTNRFTLSQFTPGEAEKITGLSTTMQRDWRRRVFLPREEGQARFDAFGLAAALIKKLLSDRGIGPQQTSAGIEERQSIGDWCAAGVIYHALRWVDAYEGDHQNAMAWNEKAKGSPFKWGAKADWLARQILSANGFGSVIPAKYFIWWADGSHVWAHSVDGAFDASTSDDPKVTGPVIVLDLQALGSLLLERCGRPLVHVELPLDPKTNKLLAPIEYSAAVPSKAK